MIHNFDYPVFVIRLQYERQIHANRERIARKNLQENDVTAN